MLFYELHCMAEALFLGRRAFQRSSVSAKLWSGGRELAPRLLADRIHISSGCTGKLLHSAGSQSLVDGAKDATPRLACRRTLTLTLCMADGTAVICIFDVKRLSHPVAHSSYSRSVG